MVVVGSDTFGIKSSMQQNFSIGVGSIGKLNGFDRFTFGCFGSCVILERFTLGIGSHTLGIECSKISSGSFTLKGGSFALKDGNSEFGVGNFTFERNNTKICNF